MKEKEQDTKPIKRYFFNKVYSASNTNLEVYEEFVRPVVLNSLEGFNGTVFAYGQTTTGKTYTMTGTPSVPGIMEYAFRDLFNLQADLQDSEVTLWVSYLEIYNEVINDLLEPSSLNLKLVEDPNVNVGTNVLGLKLVKVKDMNHAKEIVMNGH